MLNETAQATEAPAGYAPESSLYNPKPLSFATAERWDSEAPSEQWEDNVLAGRMRFGEVAALARDEEYDAYAAIKYALVSRKWRGGLFGLEEGFAEMVARAAVAGLNAIRCGAPVFDPDDFGETEDSGRIRHIRVRGSDKFDPSNFKYLDLKADLKDAKVVPSKRHWEAMKSLWAAAAICRSVSANYCDEDGPSEEVMGAEILIDRARELINCD